MRAATPQRKPGQAEGVWPGTPPTCQGDLLENQLIGTPEQVAAQVRRYVDIGITQIVINAAQPERAKESRHRSLKRFAREVAPEFSATFVAAAE